MSHFKLYRAGYVCAGLLIVALAAGVRFYAITDAYVWYDEAFSVWISALSPEAIWFHTGRDVHPPLYYLLLHCWMELFGKSPFSIRSMSAIADTLTVSLGMVMVRSLFNYRVMLVFGLFLALLPVAVRLSQEARMYALESMLLMGATTALIYWVKESGRYRYCLIYALCMTAALYTHYYAVLAASAHWLYLIVLRIHPSVRARYVTGSVWWTCNMLIVVAYIPWLFSLVDLLKNYEKIEAVGSVAWLSRGTRYTLVDTIWRFFTLQSQRSLPVAVYWLIPATMVIIFVLIVCRDRTAYRFSILLALFSFVPMLLLFIISLFVPAYLERYIAFSAVGFPLMLAVAVTYLRNKQRLMAVLAFFLVVGFELFGLKATYNQKSEMGYVQSRQVVRMGQVFDYISAHRKNSDVVVVGGGFFYFSAVFYNGSDQGMYLFDPSLGSLAVSRPNGYGASTLMLDTWDEHFLNTIDPLLDGGRRVWWVTGVSSLDVHLPYRGQGREVDYFPAGDLELRLYQTP